MVDLVNQIGIAIFGISAIWLITGKSRKQRFYGGICGLVSQPFWYCTAFINEQWGIFLLSFIYTYTWCRGIYNNRRNV